MVSLLATAARQREAPNLVKVILANIYQNSKKYKFGQQSTSSFNCPVLVCLKTLSKPWKPWKNDTSLHSHLADHCAGKFQGIVPSQYFEDWNKEFCPACSLMRNSFSPSPSFLCCLRKKPQSTELPLPVNNLPSSALPQAINLSNPNSDFEFQTPSIEEVSSQNFPKLPSF